MPITVSKTSLVQLLGGNRPEVEIGSLPLEVRKHVGCSKDTVFLTTESARHIIGKHGNHVTLDELILLPLLLERGLWLSDRNKTHTVVCNQIGPTRFKAVVKVTVDRTRTYVVTMHRMAPRQTKSLLKRGSVLREAW